MIYSINDESHVRHVQEVLERLRKTSLYIKLSKCVFSTKEVNFLEYHIIVDSVFINLSRVKIIREWLAPTSFYDIQMFLRFTNFYEWFIQKYSDIVASITDLLKSMQKRKKLEPFSWSKEVEHVLSMLKACFESVIVLLHYDLEKESQLKMNTSDSVIISILSQLCKDPANSM